MAQEKQPLVGNDELPQAADHAEIVGFAEDFFLLRSLRPLDLFQLLAQALLLVEIGIDAAAAHQFVVIAALDDPAFVEDEDLIGFFHRGNAVRNDQAGFFFERSPQPVRESPPRSGHRRWTNNRRESTPAESMISARANVARCFCPPESVTPRSPTMVSKP